MFDRFAKTYLPVSTETKKVMVQQIARPGCYCHVLGIVEKKTAKTQLY